MMKAGLAARMLRAFGWRVIFPPPPPKAVVVLYPHTSNWDFVIGILTRAAIGLPAHWGGKDTLFRGPLGTIFRALGGIPVNRRERTGFVQQMASAFTSQDRFYLVLAPEGTRSLTPGWKSGFYRIALEAGVPLALAFIDFPRREAGIADYLTLSGDEAADMAAIAQVYANRQGLYPAKQSPIRLLA